STPNFPTCLIEGGILRIGRALGSSGAGRIQVSRIQVSPEDQTGLPLAGVVGDLRIRHAKGAVERDRPLVRGGRDGLQRTSAALAGEPLKLGIELTTQPHS